MLLDIKAAFENSADASKAPAMAAYMKNNFEFLGISRCERDLIQKHFRAKIKALNAEDTLLLAKQIWDLPQREFQYYALDLLRTEHKKWNADYYAFFENMVSDKSWWDSVDLIASRLIGPYLLDDKEMQIKRMGAFAIDDNLWRRRVSIIFQLNYKDKVDLELLFEHIRLCKGDKQFFIQKAIGWALRQISLTHAAEVQDFVEAEKIEGLAKREALRKL